MEIESWWYNRYIWCGFLTLRRPNLAITITFTLQEMPLYNPITQNHGSMNKHYIWCGGYVINEFQSVESWECDLYLLTNQLNNHVKQSPS
jgi:hypothetical protein